MAAAASAQTPTPPPPPPQWRFELHGFASGTLWAQDGSADGQGQQFRVANAQRPNLPDRFVMGGDVRQTRLNFSVAGPKVFGGATPKAVTEIDFFGSYGPGAFGDVSLLPRLRLAYAELNWGAHRILFGQNTDLTFAQSMYSLTHIAQPMGFGTGNIGWRRPGVQGFHTFGDLKNKASTKVEFAWQVTRSNWNDTGSNNINVADSGAAINRTIGIGASVPVGATNAGAVAGFSQAEASGLPAFQARLTLNAGEALTVWVAGHWSRVDRNGAGNIDQTTFAPAGLSTLDVIAGAGGFKGVVGPLTLAGCGYVGKNTAPLIGGISGGGFTTAGDVHEYGFWGQLGLNMTKEISLWGFGGASVPNRADALAGGFTRLQNVAFSGLLQYRDGGYAIGLEYTHLHTTFAPGSAIAGETAFDVNQLALTGNYFF